MHRDMAHFMDAARNARLATSNISAIAIALAIYSCEIINRRCQFPVMPDMLRTLPDAVFGASMPRPGEIWQAKNVLRWEIGAVLFTRHVRECVEHCVQVCNFGLFKSRAQHDDIMTNTLRAEQDGGNEFQ